MSHDVGTVANAVCAALSTASAVVAWDTCQLCAAVAVVAAAVTGVLTIAHAALSLKS